MHNVCFSTTTTTDKRRKGKEKQRDWKRKEERGLYKQAVVRANWLSCPPSWPKRE